MINIRRRSTDCNERDYVQVLIPIKPEYLNKIMDGRKCFEFRKADMGADDFYFYATAPIKKIVAKAKVLKVLSGPPEEIWERCQTAAGISKAKYDAYYGGRNEAVAFELMCPERIPEMTIEEIGLKRAPQNYVLLKGAIRVDKGEYEWILSK